MNAWLCIDGWMKPVEIDPVTKMSGRVRIALHGPLEMMVRPGDKVTNAKSTTVEFYHYGQRKNGLPIFEYKL